MVCAIQTHQSMIPANLYPPPWQPSTTTMNLTTHTHHHLYPWPKPITKTTRPSTPRRSHKQTTRHTAKTTHTHGENPSPKLLDHQPHASLASNPLDPRQSCKQITRSTAKMTYTNLQMGIVHVGLVLQREK